MMAPLRIALPLLMVASSFLSCALVHADDGVVLEGSLAATDIQRGAAPATSWGLEDRTAFAGRLLEYRLSNSESGESAVLKVSEADSDELPKWMHFDATRKLLEGIPLAEDIGKSFQIEVKMAEPGVASEDNDGKRTVVDVFEVKVVDESSSGDTLAATNELSLDDSAPRPIRCLPGSAVTTATLVVDADLAKLTAAARSAILRAVGSNLELPVSGLRLASASGSAPIDDGSALVAGAGNVPVTDDGRPKAMLQWEVGCGNVFAAHMSILQRVETTSLDGTMASAIGHGIVGWHVANKRPTSATRLRRQVPRVFATATPTVSIAPPTRKPIPTRTVTDPEPTRVVTSPTTIISTKPTTTTKPPRVRPSTTSRPSKPPKTTKERVLRTTTSRSTSVSTVPTTRPQAKVTETRLQPSLMTKPMPSASMTSSPTPPLVVIKPAVVATVYPKLTWSGRFKQLDVSVNEIVDMELPSYAFEGGAPGRLALKLLTEDGLSASLSWLKLNETSQRLYGMPMESQVGERSYIILASDRHGASARGVFDTTVTIRPQVARPAYESSAALDIDYDEFCENEIRRLDVAKKIARAFGDPDARNLAITRIGRGSVILAWTNSTMSGDSSCPGDEINAIQSKMFNEDGTIRRSFSEAIRPYRIISVEMTKRGTCGTASIKATPSPVMLPPELVIPGGSSGVAHGVTPSLDSELTKPKAATSTAGSPTVVIIILIIIAVIIIIIITICCCVCRQRSRKSESPDKKIKQGAPIILAYELDNMDASMTPSRPLIGAGTERPPAPPGYQLPTSANGVTPPIDHRRPLLAASQQADQMSPLKYQPPPGTLSVRGQPGPSGHRRPPAYVVAT